MSQEDMYKLQLDDIVEVKIGDLSVSGKVKGIDIWEFRIRVEKDEYTCDWFPPRLVKMFNNG